jgi:hypothetical protein
MSTDICCLESLAKWFVHVKKVEKRLFLGSTVDGKSAKYPFFQWIACRSRVAFGHLVGRAVAVLGLRNTLTLDHPKSECTILIVKGDKTDA